MNILLLSTSYPANRADYRGRFVQDLAESLVERNHRVLVLTPHPGTGALKREAVNGVSVHRVSYPLRLRAAQGSLFGRFGVMETLRQQPWRTLEVLPAVAALSVQFLRRISWADLVISNWSLPMGLLAAMVRPRAQFKHLLIEHGAGARLLDTLPSPEPVFRTLMAGTDHLHFVSHTIAQTFLNAAGDLATQGPVQTIHPMPAPRRSGAAVVRLYRPPLRLLFVGRFVPIKGAELLLEALRHVPEAQLTLAGAGPGLAAAQTFVQEVGLTSRVQFLGEVGFGRLPELYAQHDALIIPSRSLVPSGEKSGETPPHEEGSPRTLLEGMGVGLVPIASASGGMPALINHGHNGLLFPPGDAASLATEINRLNDQPALCRRLGKEARKTADQWSFDSLFEMWRKNGIVL